jgi:hypothetical protein
MNNPDSPFYIGISRNTKKAWFVNQPMGKNTIGNIVKLLAPLFMQVFHQRLCSNYQVTRM